MGCHATDGTEGSGGQSRHFSDTLELIAKTVTSERVDLGTIAQLMGRRSIGALLLVLALPMALPIPAPGISVLFGLPLTLIPAQLFVGRRYVWLPARLARRSMSRHEFVAFIERGLPTLRRLERFIRPRIVWMACDWATVPIGLVCLVLAIIITLPVPLGHMLPGNAIVMLALGLLERDGLAVGFGLATATVALAVVFIAAHSIAAWLHALFA
jgi:hypothetical protein